MPAHRSNTSTCRSRSRTARLDGDTRLLFLIYALLARAKGEDVTSEDVHDAWAVWMTAQAENHEALVAFSQLDAATRAEDHPFVAAIRRVARARV